jgi:o-succinylbenzoate---CoA ligase
MSREQWLVRAAARRPDRVAIEAGDERLTYAELLDRARDAARGLEPGRRVPLTEPAGLDFVVALHGCLLAGAVAMPVDPRLGDAERAAVLANAGSSAADDPVGSDRGGAAVVVHTSGTTGAPRPVELTRANIEANALGSAVALGLDPDERWLCPLPLSHVGGLMVLLRSAIYATTAVLGPADALHDVTLASLVPTQLHRLLDAPPPAPRLRTILLGGAGASKALLEPAAAAGLPVSPTYGLTQACSQVTVAEPGDTETSGFPLPGVGVEIAPDGEILVTGPVVAGGGTLRTGDLGRLDERGRLIATGRLSELIVSGGENVAPAEVEAVLEQHPAVAEAGVFGRPDPEWGEAVVAAVVPRNGAPLDPEELRAFCRARLAGFKVPKAIEQVGVLPRTASGKLRRGELR